LRIGLFGGSFDPFHLGHFLVAQAAQERFRLHRVVFLPCAHSPLKKARPVADNPSRLAMPKTGLKGTAWAEVSDWEIRRKGLSYTVETVRAMQARSPGHSWFWIMGSDQWELLPSWKEPEELRRRLCFLVFPRPDRPRMRKKIRMREIPLRFDISATAIRERVRRLLPIRGLVFPSVESMIQRRGWYR